MQVTFRPGGPGSLRHRFRFQLAALALMVIAIGGPSPGAIGQVAAHGSELRQYDGIPLPEECTVAPRPVSDFVVPAERVPLPEIDYADLPKGKPVDEKTLAAIRDLERQLSACVNAHDFERAMALVTDAYLSDSLSRMEEFEVEWWRNPTSASDMYRRTVADAVQLPDGTVAALAGICDTVPIEATLLPNATLVYYEQVDGRWLIAEEISVEREDQWCDPEYGPDDSLIDPAYWDEVFGEE